MSMLNSYSEDDKQALVKRGLKTPTIGKRLQGAKMFFAAALKRKLITENPFADVRINSVVDESRNVFVDRETIYKVMDAAPDGEWRAIIALCRFAGLRCPSEVLSLKWTDINWAEKTIRITSPKTAHHEGGQYRLIPFFPELVTPLLEAQEFVPTGSVYVISRHRSQAESPKGWRNTNLRSDFLDIIWRAKVKEWPKLFHALRGSCETELVERFPIQTVTKWLGNSPKVALKHYLRVLPEHFKKAVSETIDDPEKLAQNRAHNTSKWRKPQKQETPFLPRKTRFYESLRVAK